MRPPSGWWTPPRMFMLVDLPEPFSPTRPRVSPGRRSKLTPCSTRTPKKLLVRPSTDSRVGSDRFVAMGSPHAQIAGAQGIQQRRRQDDAALDDVDRKQGGAEKLQGRVDQDQEQHP